MEVKNIQHQSLQNNLIDLNKILSKWLEKHYKIKPINIKRHTFVYSPKLEVALKSLPKHYKILYRKLLRKDGINL